MHSLLIAQVGLRRGWWGVGWGGGGATGTAGDEPAQEQYLLAAASGCKTCDCPGGLLQISRVEVGVGEWAGGGGAGTVAQQL